MMNNKNFVLFFGLLMSSSVMIFGQISQRLMMGAFVFPAQVTHLATFKILYKGHIYSVDGDQIKQQIAKTAYFEVTEKNNCNELYILLTSDLQRPADVNIKTFKTAFNCDYRLLKLSRRGFTKMVEDNAETQESLQMETWDMEELSNDEPIVDIPDSTIIIFVDPKWIADIQPETWLADDPLIRLPRFVFVPEVTDAILDTIASKMRLALLNISPFHKPREKRVYQVASNHLVSMMYESNV